jgi:hypothetical protein
MQSPCDFHHTEHWKRSPRGGHLSKVDVACSYAQSCLPFSRGLPSEPMEPRTCDHTARYGLQTMTTTHSEALSAPGGSSWPFSLNATSSERPSRWTRVLSGHSHLPQFSPVCRQPGPTCPSKCVLTHLSAGLPSSPQGAGRYEPAPTTGPKERHWGFTE